MSGAWKRAPPTSRAGARFLSANWSRTRCACAPTGSSWVSVAGPRLEHAAPARVVHRLPEAGALVRPAAAELDHPLARPCAPAAGGAPGQPQAEGDDARLVHRQLLRRDRLRSAVAERRERVPFEERLAVEARGAALQAQLAQPVAAA